MKQKYVALKMYLVGLTVGLFMFGWSAVAHTSSTAQANTASQSVVSSTTSTSTLQASAASVQTVSIQPRVRTRTS
jgi:hypothetical protein